MTQFKATYKGSSRTADSRYYLQIWEYRGHEYEVEVPTGWNCSTDYIYGDMRQSEQHRREQEAIDAMLDNPKEEPKKWKYEGSAQEGLDLFFNLMEGE
jgi:hypothetical protein